MIYEKQCAICLLSELDNNEKIDVMKNFEKKYYKTCSCNAHVHQKCLLDWYKYKKKCIICRERNVYMYKKVTCYCLTLNYNTYYIRYIKFYCNIFLIAGLIIFIIGIFYINKNNLILINLNKTHFHGTHFHRIHHDEIYFPY